MKLISFLGEQFRSEQYRKQLAQKEMNITNNKICLNFRLQDGTVFLSCSAHKKKPTRDFCFMQDMQGLMEFQASLIIHQTLMYMFSVSLFWKKLAADLSSKQELGIKHGLYPAQKPAFNVTNLDISKKDYCNAIVGVYCFTGCDKISAMVGKRYLKALKVLSENNNSGRIRR